MLFRSGASNFLARRSEAEADDRADRTEAARHGTATVLSFVAAGLIPLLAYLLPLSEDVAFVTAVGLTAVALFTVGASRALVTKLGFVRSGSEMLLVGSLAAAVAYGIGALAASLTG